MNARTVLTMAASLTACSPYPCETFEGGVLVGTDVCVLSDDGVPQTDNGEFLTAIGLFDDELGTNPDDRLPVHVTIVDDVFDCGDISPTGWCSGLYQGDIKYKRGGTEKDFCFSHTAFIHEWGHRLMDELGLKYWEHPDDWFGPGGHVRIVQAKYNLLYCPE